MNDAAAEANLYLELEGRLQGRSTEDFAAQVVDLARATNPTALLLCASLLTTLGTASAPLAPSPAVMEHLALLLLPLTVSPAPRMPTPAELMKASDLLNLTFVAFLHQETGALDLDDPASLITHSAGMYRDSYRATGYDFQTEAEIQGVQGHLDAWFAGRLGLSPSRALALLRAMESLSEERLFPMVEAANKAGDLAARTWRHTFWKRLLPLGPRHADPLAGARTLRQARHLGFLQHLLDHTAAALPVSLPELHAAGHDFTEGEWRALLDLIGMDAQRAAAMTSPREARARPVRILPDGRAFFLGRAYVLDEVWQAFDDVATGDPGIRDRYSKRKGRWVEERAAHLLRQVFGHNVLTTLDYPDPEAEGPATAELDALAWWGPYVVLVEVKARQFNTPVRDGPIDVRRLRHEVNHNYGDAVRQTNRALHFLRGEGRRTFRERRTGRSKTFEPGETPTILVLSVTQHHLGGMIDRTADFQAIGALPPGTLPLSVCLADLELMCEFSDGPDVFLDYVRRRSRLLNHPGLIASTEPDLFGLYLQHRLYPGQLDRPNSVFVLMNGQAPFDAWARSKRTGREERAGLHLHGPEEVLALLRTLREEGQEATIEAAMTLLEGDDREWAHLAWGLRTLTEQPARNAPFRRIPIRWAKAGINLIGTTSEPEEHLRQHVLANTVLHKYRLRAEVSLGLGFTHTGSGLTGLQVAFLSTPWRPDPALDELLRQDPRPVGVRTVGKRPRPRQPCPCGSGQPFSGCCGRWG